MIYLPCITALVTTCLFCADYSASAPLCYWASRVRRLTKSHFVDVLGVPTIPADGSEVSPEPCFISGLFAGAVLVVYFKRTVKRFSLRVLAPRCSPRSYHRLKFHRRTKYVGTARVALLWKEVHAVVFYSPALGSGLRGFLSPLGCGSRRRRRSRFRDYIIAHSTANVKTAFLSLVVNFVLLFDNYISLFDILLSFINNFMFLRFA